MELHASKILVIDDRPENVKLLERLLAQEGYTQVESFTDPEAAMAVYPQRQYDLILLDIRMPRMDGFAVMRAIQALDSEDAPPILVLTAQTDRETRLNALQCGALDFIAKPFDRVELGNRIRNMLRLRLLHRQVRDQNRILEEKVRERTRELHDTRLEIIRRLGRAAEYRDNETGMHIIRMSKISACLARALGCDSEWCNLMLDASPMHDVGKIGIPDRILLKPGKLDPAEWAIMQSHVIIGGELLSGHTSPLLELARSIALSHHEKWDGSGYPSQLRGEQIPLEGRIVAVADVFDALTSERPYKKAWSLDAAVDYIQQQRGGHFDPHVVDKFMDNLGEVAQIQTQFADQTQSLI